MAMAKIKEKLINVKTKLFSIKNKLFSKNEKIYLKYFLSLALKNKLISIMLLIFSVFIMVIIPTVLVKNSLDIASNSVPIFLFPHAFSLIIIVSSSVQLFSVSKRNNVNLYLHSSSLEDNKIVLLKQFSIYLLSLGALLINLIVSLELVFITGQTLLAVQIFFINFFSLLIANVIWTIIFTFITFALKTLAGFFVSILLALILMALPFAGSFIKSDNNSLMSRSYLKDSTSIVNVNQVDSNGKTIKTFKAIYNNAQGIDDGELSFAKKSNYTPFDLSMSISSSFAGSIFKNLDSKENGKLSLVQRTYDAKTFHLDPKSTYLLTPNDRQSLFTFPRSKQVNLLNQELKGVLEKYKNVISVDYAKALHKQLLNSQIWNLTSFSQDVQSFIKDLLGLESSKSYLYDLFSNSKLDQQLVDDFKIKIKNELESPINDLVEFLLFNDVTKENILMDKTFISSKTLEKYHINLTNFDELAAMDHYDLSFIENKLFHVILDKNSNITGLKYLSLNNTYSPLSGWKNIFSGVKDVNTWKEFWNSNNEIISAKSILTKVNQIKPDIYDFQFSDNIKDEFKIGQTLTYQNDTLYSLSWIYFLATIMIAIILEVFIMKWSLTKDGKYE